MSLALAVLQPLGHYAWPRYHNNTDLYAEWNKISSSCSALTLKKETLTADGWPLMTASFGHPKLATKKANIMFIFGVHGREYLAAEIGLALMKTLCENNARTQNLLAKANFKFFPLMNPSGRAGNLPEKKIHGEHDEDCVLRRTNSRGVDINRNFDEHWDSVEGNSAYPGPVDYRGPHPESEIETKTLIKVGTDFKPDLYIDVHTGAFTALTPYSCNTTDLPTADMDRLMGLVHHAQSGGGHDSFSMAPESGQGSKLLYVATGSTMDFFYNTLRTPYAYTWETFDANVHAMQHSAARGATALDSLSKAPQWVPDMPQMREYVDAHKKRLLARGPLPPMTGTAPAPAHTVSALQPEVLASGVREMGGDVVPPQLMEDSCFSFYNPNTPETLEHYVNSWLEQIMKASEYVAENPPSR